jgi:NADPH:quinone reductase-like Zn-dependent oxidoreductase
MKAVVCDSFGPPDILRLRDVERPTPRDHELRVRVRATTVNRTDCALRSGDDLANRVYAGLVRPRWKILGSEFAGEVDATGAAVSEFRAGDRVFGVNAGKFGTHAQYICVGEDAPVARVPPGTDLDEAAAVPDGAILALNGLRPARLQAGKTILIYGASGSIGTAGVQLARLSGAAATAVCNTKNVAIARSLGAHAVIDYTQEDFTRNGERYDVVFDAVGKLSFAKAKASLTERGAYVATDGWRNLALAFATKATAKRVLFPIPPRYTKEDVRYLAELLQAGDYRAVIDRRYRLEAVVEATKYVETGQKTGNVVLTVGD